MRLIATLLSRNKIGDLTIKYSNLPESYIKRSYEQVYWRNPKAPGYLEGQASKRRHYRFGSWRPWTGQFRSQNDPNVRSKKIFVEPIKDWSFFKGDRVEIMVGRDKGKQGIVNQVIQERNWVYVEGLNTQLRMMGKSKDFPGVCIQSEKPLLVTGQVKLVDPETLKPCEFEWRYTEEGDRVRVSKDSSRIIPIPKQAEETHDYKTKSTYVENEQKDTKAVQVSSVTFDPKLKTFEMDIMEAMGIKEERVPAKSYWY